MKLWALVLLFLCDLAMPLSPGAFRFEPGQSVEIASVQTAAAVQSPSLQPRFAAIAQHAPRPVRHVEVLRREATSPPTFVPVQKSPQYEAESLTSVDPA